MIFENIIENFKINPILMNMVLISCIVYLSCFIVSAFKKRFNTIAFVSLLTIVVLCILAPAGNTLYNFGGTHKDITSLHAFGFLTNLILLYVSITHIWTLDERIKANWY